MDEDRDPVESAFLPLFDDPKQDENYPNKRPLLAHYTSVETCEKILINDEIWFSNPLLMNDWQEVRWGIIEGITGAISDDRIKDACETPERTDILIEQIAAYRERFDTEHLLNTYIFCFSEHDPGDYDGLLSMWRGYGASGGGIAVVFDTEKFNGAEGQRLVLARVEYASDDERRNWLDKFYAQFSDILKQQKIPDDKLYMAAFALIERLKLFALFSKHEGFREEREWRAAYLPWWDEDKYFKQYFGYSVTPTGVQVKLKLPIKELPLADGSVCSLEKILTRIILGPTISSPLAKAGIHRMLDSLGKSDLKGLVSASGIPFRRT